jgi:tetratricopeptide (TPR) repeat protein
MKKIAYALTCILTISLIGCVSTQGPRIDNIPMYGQPEIQRQEPHKAADNAFVEEVSKKFKSRKEASKVWWHEGERFMNEKNYDFAMRRYNQSWLLDPSNYQPYWGFARVKVATRNYNEAFEYFNKSLDLIDDDYEKPALLADLAVAYHNKAGKLEKNEREEINKYYNLANTYFEKAVESDPEYNNAWINWSQSLLNQEKYTEALNIALKANNLNGSIFPDDYVNDLKQKIKNKK